MTRESDAAGEEMAPADARWAGTASLMLATLSIAAAAVGWGADAAVAKKALVVGTPLSLVALFLGVTAWTRWTGKVGAAISGAWLLAVAAIFGWIALRT